MTHPGGILYPGEYRADRVGSCRRSMHSLPNPLTLHWDQSCASDVKVVFLNDHCLPQVGVVPKGKYQLAARPGMAQLLHISGQGRGKRCKLLGSSACLPGRHQQLLLLLSECSHHMHRDNMIPPHPSPCSSPTHRSSDSPSAATAKSLQSCPTMCGPIDGRPPGSTIPGILQRRTMEWVAISFSNA